MYAPDRNRTYVNCLKGNCSTIELRGQKALLFAGLLHTLSRVLEYINKYNPRGALRKRTNFFNIITEYPYFINYLIMSQAPLARDQQQLFIQVLYAKPSTDIMNF